MIPTYLSNLLDKNAQTHPMVEPRLKSRFEDSTVYSPVDDTNDNNPPNTFETGKPSNRKSPPEVNPSSEKKIKNLSKSFHKNSPDETFSNAKQIHSIKSNNIEKSNLHSLEKKEETILLDGSMKQSVGSPLPKSKGVEKEMIKTIISNSVNDKESQTYGLLNKPLGTPTNNNKYFDGNPADASKERNMVRTGPPSVKISIGRIEVKAVKTTAKVPTKPKAKPEPRLTLEDYINKRK